MLATHDRRKLYRTAEGGGETGPAKVCQAPGQLYEDGFKMSQMELRPWSGRERVWAGRFRVY